MSAEEEKALKNTEKLCEAIFWRREEEAKKLIESGEVNISGSSGKRTPLHESVHNDTSPWPVMHEWARTTKMTEFLLKAGADPNIPGPCLHTPLFDASVHGNVEIVKLLLDFGADRNIRNNWQEHPILEAKDKKTRDVLLFYPSKIPPDPEIVDRIAEIFPLDYKKNE